MDKYNENVNIWVLSDLHLGHDKEFIWGKRGFNNVQEMNSAIIKNIRAKVKEEDIFYICGDLVMGSAGAELLCQIPGFVHVILGNHDTDNRIKIYQKLGWTCSFGERIKYNGQSILFTHYPTLTGNISDTQHSFVLNISGHTHSKEAWNPAFPLIYNASCEANNCSPVLLEDIIKFFKK